MTAPVYNPYYPWVREDNGLYRNTVTGEVRYKAPSGPEPKRYLRMTQRDDGLGVERHPRLANTGITNSTSVHSKVPRLGTANRYR